jgi:site-specific DNA-methyltransferase (cytosine-N4-specific)
VNAYYSDESVTLHHGDALTVLSSLPDASVNCCVTSPPYFGLRDYGVEGQLGLEASPAEYVENLRALFAQVRRVLADDGTLWLNLGDSYMSRQFGWGNNSEGSWAAKHREAGDTRPDGERVGHPASKSYEMSRRSGLPPKNLMGIPWRVAFALQDDGWILRNDIIWAKPNGMPESVTDRLATKHEHLFLFAKSPRYWFDLNAIREPHTEASLARFASGPIALERRTPGDDREANIYGKASSVNLGPTGKRHNNVSRRDSFARSTKEADVPGQSTTQHREDRPDVVAGSPLGRNPGDVWNLATQPFPEAHFAVMPRALAERAIQAGCKPSGTVLDPFSGSGTTGLAAARHGRKYVGIDLNANYLDLSLRTRLAQPGLDFDTKEAI